MARSTGWVWPCSDLADPRIVLHQTDEWVFGPEAPYEITGDVGRVVFPCGWVHDAEADQLFLYYGAADTVIGLATARFSEVLARVCAAPAPEIHRTSDQVDAR